MTSATTHAMYRVLRAGLVVRAPIGVLSQQAVPRLTVRVARRLSTAAKDGAAAAAKGKASSSNSAATREILQTLSKYLWPKGEPWLKARVIVALALLVGGKLLNIQVPFLFKDAIEKLTGGAPPDAQVLMMSLPIALLLAYGIARAGANGMQELRNAVFAAVAQRAIRRVSGDIFAHMMRLDLPFHLNRQTGAVSRVIDRGSRGINFVLSAMVFNVAPTILEIGLVSGIMAAQCGWEYAAVSIATLVLYVWYTVAVTQWRTQFRKDMNRLETEAAAKAVDTLINYETVKIFNGERHELAQYDRSLAQHEVVSLRTQTSLAVLNWGQNVIFSGGLAAVMVMAGQQILAGSMTIGDLVLVNGLLFQLSIPLNFVGTIYREVRQSVQDMEAMFALRAQRPAIDEDAPLPVLRLGSSSNSVPAEELRPLSGRPFAPLVWPGSRVGSLRFEDVHFAYSPQRPILRGLSLDVPAGSKIGIVGPSGCGKSTLVRLLFRHYDPEGGSVSVDGQDLRQVHLQSLRQAIGIVPQDTVLFNAPLWDNIAYGNLDASEAEVRRAAELAHLLPFIQSLPEGFRTVVGERGLKLSGGEKQRVALARAMLKNAPILLCDEATSALDTRTEFDIMESLRSLSRDRTTLMIAHRLSTVRDADQIAVLDQGRVVELGDHASLLARGGLYGRLWEQQNSADDVRA